MGSVIMANVKDISLKMTPLEKSGTLCLLEQSSCAMHSSQRYGHVSADYHGSTHEGTAGEVLDGPGAPLPS